MRISLPHLRRYCPQLSPDPAEARSLLDDVGIEVRRVEDDAPPGPFFVLELLANRGDHRCYAGIAREVAGRLGGGVQLPEGATLDVEGAELPVRVETDLCAVYTATTVELGRGTLPPEVLEPVTAADLRSLGAAADATNLVNLELGQPAHAFDAATIAGGITVRLSAAGETAWPLFHQEPMELPEGTLVVADEEKILAIAGVVGCEESKVTAATRRIVLESAAFDPVAVRLASRNLKVQTDASARFERGSDPSLPLAGAGRVVHLLETYTQARRTGPTSIAGSWRDPERTIALDLDRVQAFFLCPFTREEVTERLARYGFRSSAGNGSGSLRVTVPPHRLWDVANPEDLYEELARSVGYNELPTQMPPVLSGERPSTRELLKERVEEVLLGMGFYEIITDAFYDRRAPERLGLAADHPLAAHVEILNSLDASFSLLKNNCLVQALEAVSHNLRHGTENLRIYEWTRIFPPDPEGDNGVCNERRVLWLAACGLAGSQSWADPPRPVDIWFLKGVVEEIAADLRIPLRVVEATGDEPLAACLHPYRRGAIELAGRRVGILGEVRLEVARAFRIKRQRPYFLELAQDPLWLEEERHEVSLPPPRPPSIRMVAFTLPHKVRAAEVVESLRDEGPEWLESVSIVDSYSHEEGGAPVRTVTYALEYRNDQAERSAEELNSITESLSGAVERRLAHRGVHLRTGD